MPRKAQPWLERAYRFTLWAYWLALVVGIIASVYGAGGSPASLVASGLAGSAVLLASAIPRRRLTQRFVTEGFALASSVLSLGAVTLTGGRDSAFVLLSLIPPIQATLVGGLRVGAATGGLSAALLVAAELAREGPALVPTIGIAITYLIVVATISQLVRILTDVSSRAEEIEARSKGAEAKLASLEHAHDLLSRLAEMRDDGTSLPDMGREALELLADRPEIEGALAVLVRPTGQVIIAQRGVVAAGAVEHQLPLTVGHRSVGHVRLFFGRQVPEPELAGLSTVLRPLALAFANALLLEDIAQNAIERERVRLARDLHDDIGPSLASLGLSLDVALMQHETEPALAAHMQGLRQNVSVLINDVRASVADLRAKPAGSLSSRLADVALGLGNGGPTILVELDERRPPRPSLMPDLVAVLVEGIRNAHRHSSASYVRVHGWTDFDKGSVAIHDNGSGFDPSRVGDGHYGLIGMKERATKTGMDLGVSSNGNGTSIEVKWGLK